MFSKVKELIDDSNNIYIVGHVGPDGDAIGSSFALCLALRNMGKNAKVIMPKYSDHFSFLPGIEEAVESVNEEEYDLLVAVDSSNKNRLAITEEDYNKAKKVAVIDHHVVTEEIYGDARCVDPLMPATCQIMYDFLTFMNVKMTKEIATYLYTGIVTDSGTFSYSSTKPSTLKIASSLIETGIDFSDICRKLNHTMKEAKLKLIGIAINNMEVYYGGKLRYTYIDYKTIESLGLTDEDSEGMTNYLLMPEGTEVAVYVREKSDGSNKVSLRSRENIDVSKIAISFNGGGHARAAGYTMEDDLDIGKNKVIDVVGVMLGDDSTN